MKPFTKKILVRVLKTGGISIASILALLFILPFIFPEAISKKIKAFANESITSKLDFSSASLSFFNHFPSLTLTIQDVSILGSAPFQKDTLVNAKEVALGIDITTIFSDAIRINKIYFSHADINVKVNKEGKASYNIYKSSSTESSDTSASTTGLRLESIVLENCNLHYDDQSIPVIVIADNLNYTGNGDLSKSVFDLNTRMSVDSFSFVYNGEAYVNKKPLKAKLITRVNTNSLALVFEKNRIRINRLPVFFEGTFDFLKNGYNMDFRLASAKATLEEIITAIPPDLTDWLDDTKVKGDAAFNMQLKGIYSKALNAAPDLDISLNINGGYIAYKGAPAPVENLLLKLDARMPLLNADSLCVNIDTLYFNLDKGYFSAASHTVGLEQPFINSTVKADIDLDKWDRAMGLNDIELKGNCTVDFKANGKYTKAQNPAKWRKDIIITSIPVFSLQSTMKNGYLKFASLPQALHDISFNLKSACLDSMYRHTTLEIDHLNAVALNNNIKGYAKIVNPGEPKVDADITTNLRLQDIKQFIPVEKINISGDLALAVKVNGTYNPGKKLFPVTEGKLHVQNGEIQTVYYSGSIQKINIATDFTNTDGTLAGTAIQIQPVSFEFEGQPFTIKADIKNPEDVQYDIKSAGTIDVGKIYKVFAQDGYDVSGLIETNLDLKGKQSDAAAGRYQLLVNSGALKLKEVKLYTESFPAPFIVHSGIFSFKQDKMWFNEFTAAYGSSSFAMNGYLNNVINYIVGNDEKLHGKFTVKSDYVNVKEFTAFSGSDPATVQTADTAAGQGVVMIPGNLSVSLDANIKKVNYDSVFINDFKGQLVVDAGKISLKDVAFKLTDASFKMNASYYGETPRKAFFDFKVKADSFSIAKAYKEIPMFREMASSASTAQGVTGLDYTLAGRLDEHMNVVYPSIKGGGVLTLKNIKLMGFKLMNAVSKETDHEDLKDADIKGVAVKTKINNNIITLERVKLRIAGLRPRFEGQISLDGLLNLKGRIGLPPLGIIGIPFMVSGTSDAPRVKLKRDKEGKLLQEKEDNVEGEE
ncbi:MAG: AsmA-like C-terminal region-containing protein [Agriterribacter sp.]